MAGPESSDFDSLIAEAVDSIASRWSESPRFGIVLGTGAGIVAEQIEAEVTIPYGSIANS